MHVMGIAHIPRQNIIIKSGSNIWLTMRTVLGFVSDYWLYARCGQTYTRVFTWPSMYMWSELCVRTLQIYMAYIANKTTTNDRIPNNYPLKFG